MWFSTKTNKGEKKVLIWDISIGNFLIGQCSFSKETGISCFQWNIISQASPSKMSVALRGSQVLLPGVVIEEVDLVWDSSCRVWSRVSHLSALSAGQTLCCPHGQLCLGLWAGSSLLSHQSLQLVDRRDRMCRGSWTGCQRWHIQTGAEWAERRVRAARAPGTASSVSWAP